MNPKDVGYPKGRNPLARPVSKVEDKEPPAMTPEIRIIDKSVVHKPKGKPQPQCKAVDQK